MNIINSNINTINTGNIYDIIYNTTTLHEINNILYEAQKQKIRILNELWEDCYKERCPSHYISFSDFVKDIIFWNDKFIYEDPKILGFQKDCYNTSYPIYISDIMDLCRKYNFEIGIKPSKMICEACACKDCPCLEEYFNCTCAECKKDFYKMYAGYCGECDN